MSDTGRKEIVSATDEHACEVALGSLQAFLHGELPQTDADEIRRHLMICDSCMGDFDVEDMISAMVKRCTETPCATLELRGRITSLTLSFRARQGDDNSAASA